MATKETSTASAKSSAAASEIKKEDIFTIGKLSLSKDTETFKLSDNYQHWSETVLSKLFGTADKDGNYFSYMFVSKMFGESHKCKDCGIRNGIRFNGSHDALHLYVIEGGIIGKQNIQCENCGRIEEVVSGDNPSLLPSDSRLEITREDLKDMCTKMTHFELLHDLMEMLQIAAMEEDIPRKEKHYIVASFMLHNARRICEEWCRPENADLRQRKFLRLRAETLLNSYKPTFTPDMTEEYHEMYDMMAQCFRQNRVHLLRLLYLIKSQLIDNPSRSTFMTWVGIAMMQSENYPRFKQLHDPRCFMKMEANDFQSLKEQYLALDVPLGIKKIPVVFVLFEIPRFFYYAEFLNQRLGRKRVKFVLMDRDKSELVQVKLEEESVGFGREVRKGKKKTMICPEAHLKYLSRQEAMDRERLYQTYRDRRKKMFKSDEFKTKTKTSTHALEPPFTTTPASGGQDQNGVTESEMGIKLTKAQIKRRRKKEITDQTDVTATSEGAVVVPKEFPPVSNEAIAEAGSKMVEEEYEDDLIPGSMLPAVLNNVEHNLDSSKKLIAELDPPDEVTKMDQLLSEAPKTVLEERSTSRDYKFTIEVMEFARVVTNTSEAGISNLELADEDLRDAKALSGYTLHLPELESAMPKSASKSPSDASKSPSDASKSPSDASKSPSDASKSPPDASKSPSDASKSPSDASKSPSDASKSPSDASKSPSDASKSPSDASKSPSDASKSPSDASKSPSDASKSPSDASKSPSDASKSPSDASKSPSDASKSPSGASKSPSDASKSPSDVSKSPSDVSKSPSDASKSPSDASKSPSVASTSDTSRSTSDASTSVSDPSAADALSVLVASKSTCGTTPKPTLDPATSVSDLSKPATSSKSGRSGYMSHVSKSSSQAKCTHDMRAVRTSSGITESVPAIPDGSSSASLSAAGASYRKIVTRGDVPIIHKNEAYEASKNGGKDCPFKTASNPKRNRRPKLSEDQIDSLMTDFSSLSYPFLKSLIESLDFSKDDDSDKEIYIPEFNKVVSVLSDPFFITKNPNRPMNGATVYFMREDAEHNLINKRNNVKLQGKSIAENITDRLLELMSSVATDRPANSRNLDYNFQAMEFCDLPAVLQTTVSVEETGSLLETAVISLDEFRDVLAYVKLYGKTLMYDKDEPVNRLTVLCIPLELNLTAAVLDTLSLDLFRLTDFDKPIPEVPDVQPAPPLSATSSASALDSGKVSQQIGDPSSVMKDTKILYPDSEFLDAPVAKSRNASRRARKEAFRLAKKALQNPNDPQPMMIAQVEAEILRREGYNVKTDAGIVTILTNKDGVIFHIIEDGQSLDPIKDYLSKRYNLVSLKQDPGYFNGSTKDHRGDTLVDPIIPAAEDVTKDRFQRNRKKLKSKTKAIQDINVSSLHLWSGAQLRSSYAKRLRDWLSFGFDWPEGMPHGTEDFGDRELLSGPGDEDLVSVLTNDNYGNHSMLKRLTLNTVDAANELAADIVIKRYIEQEDEGPAIDPKVPECIFPANGFATSTSQAPIGTNCDDIPILMKYAAPHKQMRALDAMKVPYKYELTQVLTPQLSGSGVVVLDAPKRITVLSKIAILSKSKYDSKQFAEVQDKAEDDDRLKRRTKPGHVEKMRQRLARMREKNDGELKKKPGNEEKMKQRLARVREKNDGELKKKPGNEEKMRQRLARVREKNDGEPKKKPGNEEKMKQRLARVREKNDGELKKEREMENHAEEEPGDLDGITSPPQISKAKRKKLRKRMKKLEAANSESKVMEAGQGCGDHVTTPDHSSSNIFSRLPDYPQVDDADVEMESEGKDGDDSVSSEEDSRAHVIARERFQCCDSCGNKIATRILLCAGCKKVAYCNFRCQKASWKVHKKVCSYALRKGGKESTG